MKKLLIYITSFVLLLSAAVGIYFIAKPDDNSSNLNPQAYKEKVDQATKGRCVGTIENSDDAISKAKQIFIEIYDEEYIKSKEPLTASYNSNVDTWTVHGASKPPSPNISVKGGGINIKIQGSTGDVIAFWLDK